MIWTAAHIPLFLLWIYSPGAWDTYQGPLSAGWYIYDSFPTESHCDTAKKVILEVQEDGGDALCRIDDYDNGPEPLAVLLKESRL